MDQYGFSTFGKRRGWILLTQIGLAMTLLLLANMNPSAQVTAMSIVALGIAFFSASQDIAIDAYRTDVLPTNERGLGAAYFVFAYRIAMLLSGGLALVFADYLGWKLTYEFMAVLILLSMLPAYFAPMVPDIAPPSHNILNTTWSH